MTKKVAKGEAEEFDNGSDALPMVENEFVDETVDEDGVVGDLTQDNVFVPRDGVNGPVFEGDESEEDEDEEEKG